MHDRLSPDPFGEFRVEWTASPRQMDAFWAEGWRHFGPFFFRRYFMETGDELKAIQVEVLCWCGVPGRFNARVRAGRVIHTGDTVLVADTVPDTEQHRSGTESNGVTDTTETTIRYQVLCRRHFRLGDLGPDVAQSGQLRLA